MTLPTDIVLYRFKRCTVCNTRDNSLKLTQFHIISKRDGHFFGINRVINAWNSLTDPIATSPTVACFKHRLAKLNFTL